jgi:chromosomal replication initiation ATPase DnaA
MKQHTLGLPVEPRFGRADFLVSDSNREAFEWIERWPDWPARALLLHGPPGCGKTHLAHLWSARARATLVAGETLTSNGQANPSGPIAVDNAERAAEEPLLHLYNSVLEGGHRLLLTAGAPPAALPIKLADLASRLRSLPAARIAPPDDELLAAVLVKHFADRQLNVKRGVVAYLVPRIERSFAMAASLAARLDDASLSERKPISVKLARAVLADDV